MIKFWNLFVKDTRLMLSSKFLLVLIGSLVIYSLYINLIYSVQDIQPSPILIYDPMERAMGEDLVFVDSKDELADGIEANDKVIAVDYSLNTPVVSMIQSENEKVDKFTEEYVVSRVQGQGDATDLKYIGELDREAKLRREMTCEVLFFELIAVIFLGVTSLLFKEKSMGTIKVFGTVPANEMMFILSKTLLFLLINILFTIALCLINVDDAIKISLRGLPHVIIISIMMSMLSHICVFTFKDFRQFGFAYAFIVIFLTAPVFLAANTAITWNWIEYYPIYILYMNLKSAFFNMPNGNIVYYGISILILVGLAYIVKGLMKRELAKE